MRERTAASRLRDRLEGKGGEFGERVRYWRIERGMSKEQLATKAGISVDFVKHIEEGHVLSDSTRRKIAKALGVQVAELFR